MQAGLARFAGVLALILGAGVAQGATIKQIGGPAEVPPSGYSGNHYVDSRGCLFIRAGSGARVSWVPRAERNRQVLCGYKPTAVAGTLAPSAAAGQRRNFVEAQVPEAFQYNPASAPRGTAQPRGGLNLFGGGNRTVSPAPAPTLVSAPTQTAAAAPARAPQQGFSLFATPGRAAHAPSPAPAPTVVSKPPAAPAAPSAQPATTIAYAETGANAYWTSTHDIRRGPQPIHPSAYVTRTTLPNTASPTGVHVAAAPAVPEGYRPVYPEGRLNPNRGVGTAQGAAEMEFVWTSTVPRRLVDVRTGREMTTAGTGLIWPYTDLALQTKHLGVRVSSRATTAPVSPGKAPAKSPWPETPILPEDASPNNMTQLQPVILPEQIEDTAAVFDDAAPTAPVPGGSFVQVATFGVPANATRTLARFDAAGLPTRSRPLARGGKSYDIVLLGPFTEQAELSAALSAARAAGFSDAFTTK